MISLPCELRFQLKNFEGDINIQTGNNQYSYTPSYHSLKQTSTFIFTGDGIKQCATIDYDYPQYLMSNGWDMQMNLCTQQFTYTNMASIRVSRVRICGRHFLNVYVWLSNLGNLWLGKKKKRKQISYMFSDFLCIVFVLCKKENKEKTRRKRREGKNRRKGNLREEREKERKEKEKE